MSIIRYVLENPASVVLYGALLILTLYSCYQRLLSPLSTIPGPFLASLTNLWWVRIASGKHTHLETIKLHDRYGDVVRIGPNDVLTCEPGAFKKIYGAGNKFAKSDFYQPLQGNLKWDLTGERNENLHREERRLVQRAYSMGAVKGHESAVDSSIQHFLQRISPLKGHTINIGDWLGLFAIDTITEVTFSKRFGYLDRGGDDGLLARAQDFLASACWIGYARWLAKIHDLLIPVFGVWLGHGIRSTRFRSVAEDITKERMTKTNISTDIVAHLLHVREENPESFSDSDLYSTLTSNIFAGSDTTAISLRSMFWHLLKNPDKLNRFLDELKERRSAGLLSDPVKFSEAEKWPYLQAVMYESMRCHSAFATHLPRVVPTDGLWIKDKYFLPVGTCVGTNPWAIHLNKAVFGPDADQFIPERWLDESRKGELQRYFFGFGGGSRTCLGRNIVWLEMSKLLPTFFEHFTVKLADPDKPLPVINKFLAIQDGPEVVLEAKPEANIATIEDTNSK